MIHSTDKKKNLYYYHIRMCAQLTGASLKVIDSHSEFKILPGSVESPISPQSPNASLHLLYLHPKGSHSFFFSFCISGFITGVTATHY